MRYLLLVLLGCQTASLQPNEVETHESLPTLNDRDTESILWLASHASYKTLDERVGLDVRAVENIVRYRNGKDEQSGTDDDIEFGSIKEIDGIKYVGPAGMELMLRYVQTHDVLVRIPSHAWGVELEMTARCVGLTWGDVVDQSFGDELSVTLAVDDDAMLSLLAIDQARWDIQSQLPLAIGLDEDGHGETGRCYYNGDDDYGDDGFYFYDIVVDSDHETIGIEIDLGIELEESGWGLECTFETSWDLVGVHVFGIAEGSREALAILDAVNWASLQELDDEVRLDSRAAENILDAREVAPIASLTELDAIPYVGESAFEKLRHYVAVNTL